MSLDISLFWLMKESATDSDKLPRDSRRFSARQARPPPDRYPVIYRVCMRSRLSIGTFRAVSVAVSFRHAASSPRRPPPPSAVGRHTPIVQLPGIAAPLLTKRRGRQQQPLRCYSSSPYSPRCRSRVACWGQACASLITQGLRGRVRKRSAYVSATRWCPLPPRVRRALSGGEMYTGRPRCIRRVSRSENIFPGEPVFYLFFFFIIPRFSFCMYGSCN